MKKVITILIFVICFTLIGLILPAAMAGIDFAFVKSIAAGAVQIEWQEVPIQTFKGEDGWQIFQDPDFGFEIQYPDSVNLVSNYDGKALNSGLNSPSEAPVWKFSLVEPKLFEGTNLIEASIIVNILPVLEGQTDCSAIRPGSIDRSEIEINGRSYTNDLVTEGVMGEMYERRVSSTYMNAVCYEITELIHYQNPESLIEDSFISFPLEEVLSTLDQVRDTFLIFEVKNPFPDHKTPVLAPSDYIDKSPDQVGDEHVYGLDVSHWQGDIGWLKVANAGYDFAFVKGTEGRGWTDVKFHTNMAEGENAGVYLGVYHFARPDLGNTGAEEAEYFLSVVGDYLESGYLRPVLDLEVRGSLGEAALSAWVMEWMQTVESRTGISPLLYTNLNYINNYLNHAVTEYGLWIAYWSCEPNPTFSIPPTGDWGDWDFWQYYGPGGCGNNAGYVPGISTNIDLNIFNGVLAGLSDFDAASPLWVSLTSDTYLASSPYYADITADVNGDAQGPIDFYFWWDCPSLDTEYDLINPVCGVLPEPLDGSCLKNEQGMSCKQVETEVIVAEHTYTEVGNFTAKVVVERGEFPPAEDRYKITTVNPIKDIRIFPDTGYGTMDYPFNLYTRVFIDTSAAGSLMVEIIQNSSGESLDSLCKEVPGDSYLEVLFDLEFTHSTAESVPYSVWARYRPGGGCPIEDSNPDDRSWDYSVLWGLPEIEFRTLGGSAVINGGTDFQGEIRITRDVSLTYSVENNSTSVPLSISQVDFENIENVSIISFPNSLEVSPDAQEQFEMAYVVQEVKPFHFDIVFTHNDDQNNPYRITVQGEGISPFVDLETDFWAYDAIEQLRILGITTGCLQNPSPMYCPEDPVIRAQMAVFIEKILHGASFSPPQTEPAFEDILAHWAEYWITKLKQDGITNGCSPGYFCPDDGTSRAEIAVFLVRLRHGAGYVPPDANGTIFGDVPREHWAASWIEQLAADGGTSGCGNGNFCPEEIVTRAEMAVFLNNSITQLGLE